MKRSFLFQLIGVLGACLVFGVAVGGILSLVTNSADASERKPEAPRAVAAVDLYRPSLMPDRIVLTWTGEPTTTQTVTWRTSLDVTQAFAEVAVAEAGPGYADKAKRIEAETKPYRPDEPKWNIHCAEMTKLSPGTTYAYRVGDGANWSEWFQFRTASATPEPFSFIYVGDAQNDIRGKWSRVIRQAFADAPRAVFTLHAGDLVGAGENDTDWGEWFAAGSWINAMIPVVATPGNHEYLSKKNEDGSRERWLTRYWGSQFRFPANGPEGMRNSVFYIDFQNLRLVSLNSNERETDQVEWMDKVMNDDERRWTVATFHHPVYATARERDNASRRETWKPVFDRHHVDLVLTGHDHSYGRSGVLTAETNVPTGVNIRSDASGTVYVVSVSGPKMYELDRKPGTEFRRSAEDTQLYQIITIDGDTLKYEARTAVGEVYDAFTLKKRPGRINEIVEQVPDSPERRRPPKEEKVQAAG